MSRIRGLLGIDIESATTAAGAERDDLMDRAADRVTRSSGALLTRLSTTWAASLALSAGSAVLRRLDTLQEAAR